MKERRRDHGEQLRYRFAQLSPDSVVADLGGFRGQWTLRMYERYRCVFHVFEPHPRFAEELKRQRLALLDEIAAIIAAERTA